MWLLFVAYIVFLLDYAALTTKKSIDIHTHLTHNKTNKNTELHRCKIKTNFAFT